MKRIVVYFTLVFLLQLIIGCSDTPVPRPRGYVRTDFPEKEYVQFDSVGFPYRFKYPSYARVKVDNSYNAEPYWVNINFDDYKAKIHISYKDANGRLDSLMEDSRALAYKHTYKAESITERFFEHSDKKVYGLLYNMKGNTASAWQFYVTDSASHFLRGALYFSVSPNRDSLAPSIDFLGKDLIVLMESVEWKNNK
ncbi:MAG: gliding motility lipoprotein GldD [Bacteroidales bacterium]|jgi:gliding motility-associated lipoprotein GldD|nr:gliding motility lipoprotein GldD [Bacteroidales bacterium]MDY0196685.1 gliding motility lipoprotein GldD [Tenuifilaceae bacterium]